MDASVQLNLFQAAFHSIEYASMPSFTEEEAEDSHPWIPFPCSMFVEAILEAYTIYAQHTMPRKPSFLDIGCGIGTKVMLADVIFEAHGFDIVEKYIQFSRQLGCRRTFVKDAMIYEDYGDFDILYYYAPFRDEVLQRRFEKYLHQRMRPGQLLIPRNPMTMWERLPDFEKLGDYVYLHTERAGSSEVRARGS